MSRYLPQILDHLNKKLNFSPRIALVLGSGLSDTIDQIENSMVIPYKSIPHYPRSTVQGHAGEFIAGYLNGVPVIVAKGRFHYYEGYDFETITLPIRVFEKLGVELIIITNAAGSARDDFAPGTLMAINGHMDGTFRHNKDKPVVIKGAPYYTENIIKLLERSAAQVNIEIKKGIYCWTLGPTFETAEEVEYLRKAGTDAVGMSTVPEILMAGELGVKTLGISCITNFGAGITNAPLTHEEVIETTAAIKGDFNDLMTTFIQNFAKNTGI